MGRRRGRGDPGGVIGKSGEIRDGKTVLNGGIQSVGDLEPGCSRPGKGSGPGGSVAEEGSGTSEVSGPREGFRT